MKNGEVAVVVGLVVVAALGGFAIYRFTVPKPAAPVAAPAPAPSPYSGFQYQSPQQGPSFNDVADVGLNLLSMFI